MTITISADFDAGNIEVQSLDGARAELTIRKDHKSDFYQWFYFRVDGAAGRALELNITNCTGAAYPLGWPDYRACVSDDNVDWRRADTRYADGTLTIRHTPAGDMAWFAYFAPYSSDRHQALVNRIAGQAGVTHRLLGRTLDGRPLDLLTLGNGPKQVWLYARQHPGETMAEWWMEGALDFLVSDDAAARKLRDAATLHVVPNMNPDGSARGHLRTNAAGKNLNREWADPTMDFSPVVFLVSAAMDETGGAFAMDVHGDEAIPFVFMAGFDGVPSLTPRQVENYDAYLAALEARTADFQTKYGYPKAGLGKANMTMSTNQLAERFGAVRMTLEMPFKDNKDAPDPVEGWSPKRSKALAVDCMRTLAEIIDRL